MDLLLLAQDQCISCFLKLSIGHTLYLQSFRCKPLLLAERCNTTRQRVCRPRPELCVHGRLLGLVSSANLQGKGSADKASLFGAVSLRQKYMSNCADLHKKMAQGSLGPKSYRRFWWHAILAFRPVLGAELCYSWRTPHVLHPFFAHNVTWHRSDKGDVGSCFVPKQIE